MLLEAAMVELCCDAAAPNSSTSPSASPLQSKGQTPHNVVEMKGTPHSTRENSNQTLHHVLEEEVPCPDRAHSGQPSPHESPLFKDDNSKDSSSDEFSSSNAGSSISTSSFDDASCTNEGLSLLQDDNEFVSRVLNREPSNLGESSRFGSYRSMAAVAVAAGGVPFQWEAEPGKSKAPSTIKEDVEEEDLLAPLSLPPIRLAAVAAAHIPPHLSPSHSATSTPRSLTGKVKSLISHVKKPSFDHFSFSSILETQKSPSKKSYKKGRRNSSLSASEHGYLSSSPSKNYTTTFNGNGTNVQRSGELYAPRESLNSSDPSSSPYYFSPLSNTSYQGFTSPRFSTAQSLSGIVTHPHMAAAMRGLRTPPRASDTSISSLSSGANASAKAPSMLASCLLTLTAMSDDASPSSGGRDHQNGHSSLSFASPEMEILDEGLLTSANLMAQPKNKRAASMLDFINRGGPSINRSFSTSQVTFVDDMHRSRPAPKSKFYSAQLNNLAQPKSAHFSAIKGSTNYNANLDALFPLKRPNVSGNLVLKYASQSDESSDDRQAYADALDTSLDCSVMTDNEELNSMVQSIMKEQPTKEIRPAHEVVMQANDKNGYAYSPIASAFVFSPRKKSQNGANHYFKPSTRSNSGSEMASINGGVKGQHYNGVNQHPKSILKKTYSHELNRTQSLKPNGVNESVPPSPPPRHTAFVQQSKSLSRSGSQKISSVLLRFAEAEEQLYNSKGQHHPQNQNALRSPACIQPMCSFLGRAFLCRSKLASHAGRLHT